MRRLQSIQYFADLENVLQTTYEHHVIGTSELMKNYPKSILKIRINIYKNFLHIFFKDEKDRPDKLVNKNLRYFYNGYTMRLSDISSIPSLLGMLATPPLRRPLGTALKRTLMKVMNEKLYHSYFSDEGGSGIKSILDNMKENIIKFYYYLLISESQENRGKRDGESNELSRDTKPGKSHWARYECLHEFIEPLNTFIDFARGLFEENLNKKIENFNELVVKAYCLSYLNMVERLYTDRLTPFKEKNGKGNKHMDYYLPTAFLLRFRTLGTALGSGYGIKIILNKLYNYLRERDLKKVGGRNAQKSLLDALNDALNSLYKLGESILINNSTTLIHTKELREIRFNFDNSAWKAILPTLIGVPEIMINEGSIILEKEGTDRINASDGFSFISQEDLEKVLRKRDEEITLLKSPGEIKDIDYYDRYVACCILKPKNYMLEGEESVKPIINNINLNNLRKEELFGTYLLIDLLTDEGLVYLAELLRDEANIDPNKLRPLIEIVPKRMVRPFLSHFKINLIQSDILPSAYQLDLLHRLDKDINIGIRVDYENLDDIVLNLDIYSFLTFATLSSIYMYLFSDTTTLSKRVEILYKINKQKEAIALDKDRIINLDAFDIYLLLYFKTLSMSFYKIKNDINNLYRKIDSMLEGSRETLDGRSKEGVQVLKVLEAILKASRAYELFLESYSKLLDLLIKNYVIDKYNLNYENDVSTLLEKLLERYLGCNSVCGEDREPFLSLVDKNIKNIIINKNMYEGDNSLVLVHVKVPLSEIILRSGLLVKLASKYYNGISYTILHALQNVYGPRLSSELKEILKLRLERYFGSLFEVVDIIVQVPVQGILKFYYHLPESVTLMPRAVESIDPAVIRDQVNHKGLERYFRSIKSNYEEIQKRLMDYIGQTTGEQDYIKHLVKRRLSPGNMATVPGTNVIILPDLRLWESLGPVERSREFEPFNRDASGSNTRFLFRTVNIIIIAILKINKKYSNISKEVSLPRIQNELINSVAELATYMMGASKNLTQDNIQASILLQELLSRWDYMWQSCQRFEPYLGNYY